MENNEIKNNMVCPKCGSNRLQITTETTSQTQGKDYSAGKGCLGYLMFGPLGFLCGSCGQQKKTTVTNKQYWVCPDCGNKFRNPDDIKVEIDSNKKQFSALLIATFLMIIGLIIIHITLPLDPHAFMILAYLGVVMEILACILIKVEQIKKQKELLEIENGMARFK